MVANKSMGFRPWLQHAAALRLVAMLQNSISQAIQLHRSNHFGISRDELVEQLFGRESSEACVGKKVEAS